ncbi:hypothetical protein NCS57_00987600 [Fusarium keratoplasticum]|uniref:Uncharacterized protein n=1 Tax=Fusarium keratoplasticum TaxID=1328300 RepID=A0ACC0QLY9_9HYPO|nr:hypothetical protein NCS57_00987600 [Fusarium keratoplasticum]KAI8660112.1 hypothetical protein NCS57_00987600 [Fusarium keratoplasticum]
MGKSTKRRDQADGASAPPQKRRRHREPEPETDIDSERGHSSSPIPAKKVPGRPGKNATTAISKDTLKATRSFLEKRRPPVREEDVDKYVGPTAPPLNNMWTQQDEDAMMAEWNASPEKVVYASINGPNGVITTMWKVCLRVFRCSPLALISPRQGLRYQPLAGPSQAGLWSREFCNRLTALFVYPVWQGRPIRLAMLLQYAVICRTDDRRPWIPHPSCNALANLRQSMEQNKGSQLLQSVHKMHKEARALAIQAGQVPCTLSDLFLAIHRTVKGWTFDRIPEVVTSSSGFEVYSVTIHDLKVVAAAINATINCTVDEAYEAFKTAKGSGLEIPKASQLREFYERAAQQQLRQIAMAHRDDEGEGEGEGEEMAGPQPESESESESEPESSGSEPELEDHPASVGVPDDEPESESKPESDSDSDTESDGESDDEPSRMDVDDGFVLGYEGEVDDAPASVPPALLQVPPRRRVPTLPSPQATATNAPMTPMASHNMQDVMKVVNDILKKELDEMKSSLESFQEGIRLEMTKVQKRQDEIQQCQARQEAAIKALTEAKTSQHQAPENLEKEVATGAEAIETVSEQIRGIDDRITPARHSQADNERVTGRVSGSPLPSTEENRSGVMWKGTKLYILNAPKDWEPPQNCPEPPEKDELWLSRRGSKMSRHPLDCLPQRGESAIQRAMRYHGDAKDSV